MSRNHLNEETSPYLLQHKDNPVHWRAWGPEALAEATRRDVPILLSVGYSACHWCHVMAHESFEDEAIAAVMNEHFVNVKVDREERPDLDTIYQSALAVMGEHGGWPLTMFLTPEGEPFWGGTYFPPSPRYGRPGFAEVLTTLSRVYAQDRDKAFANRDSIRSALDRMESPPPAGGIDPAVIERVAARVLRDIDPIHGGLQGAPKFPQPSILELAWRGWERSGAAGGSRDGRLRAAVLKSLERMAQGGIYDHLGGGFARYSTDAEWLVPHFEKMLYDNAQLIELMLLAWGDVKAPLFEARIRETIAWLIDDMTAEGGAFAAALDADSEGVEGKYYVWSLEEVEKLLGPDFTHFTETYDVTPFGNWEGHTILNRSKEEGLDPDFQPTDALLATQRATLLAHRYTRVPPGRDDKVLADWNGMAIAALARAGAAFGETSWIDRARSAFDFIATAMAVGDGRLHHSYRAGKARHPGTLDDYAGMMRGALALYEVTGEQRFIEQAEHWADTVERHHRDPAGGYYLAADDTQDVIRRTKPIHDNAVPSGNGQFAQGLARLFWLTGQPLYRDRAEALLATFSGELSRSVMGLGSLLGAADLLDRAVQIVVVGDPAAPETQALLRAAHSGTSPARVIQPIAPGAVLPEDHPAHGKTTSVGGSATVAIAYVCIGPVCSPPVTTPDDLSQLLDDSPAP